MGEVAKREPIELDRRGAPTLGREVEVLRRFCRCGGCGKAMSKRSEWVYDHHIALELGGKDTAENLRPLCHECDKPKTALDQKMIAKAKRLAGETCTAPSKRPLKSRTSWPQGRKLQSRGFEKR